MPELLDQIQLPDARGPGGTPRALPTRSWAGEPGEPALAAPSRVGGREEHSAREQFRDQIAALERQLGELFATAFPRLGFDFEVGAAGGPRVLGIAELERVRDALVARLSEAQVELARRADVEEANRELIELMIARPDQHRWVRVSNEQIGEARCRHWHSRPRWGIFGVLLGWWRVKLSSGCPLAGGCDLVVPRPDQLEPSVA